jgi:hypothetical protein
MFRINLPVSDGYLLLTPRLGGMSRYTQAILLIAFLVVILLLLWRIYRYELQFITRKAASGLLVLRCLVIGFIFCIVALKPTMRYVSTHVIPSRVLIAIDRSDSMSVIDPQRSPVEALELARGLKLANDLADERRLKEWIEQLKRGSIPGDAAYRTVLQRMEAVSRAQLAQRVIGPEGIDMLNALRQEHHLDVVGFNQKLGELPDDAARIHAILAGDGKNPGQSYTDLKLPLKRALEQRGDQNEGLLGVILLSDGQHNWGAAPSDLAEQLGNTENKTPIPVYTVVCGARIPPTDLAIVSAKAAPPTVFKHGSTNIDVRLLANNIPAGKIKITISYPVSPELPDRKPVIEYVEHDGNSQPLPKSIPVKMDRAATETLTVTVEAIPRDGSKVDDRFPENNTRSVNVNVAPDKAKVLVVDGEARWELHYLHTALIRDETMDTKSVVFDQPRINAIKEENIKEMKLPDLKLPPEDELLRNDCIILGDVATEQLPIEERQRLEKYVAERGGTLVMLAGKCSMPLEFLRGNDPFARLLPIRQPRIVDRKDGIRVALTAEGKQTGFLRLEDDAGSSDERWSALPPHFWAITGKAKEGAVALAYCQTGDRNPSPETERDNVLIARQNYGFGRVVYVGLDSTWRWRFKQGDKFHHRFWSQVIRWAASDRALIAGNEFVRFGVREPVYRADQEVEILVRLNEKVKKLRADALAGARLYRKTKPDGAEEAVVLTPLKPHPFVPGELEGQRSNLPPGDYEMELVIPDIEEKLNGPDGKKLRTSFKILPPDTGELLNLATNWERMSEIAQKSGGEMLSADRAGELLDKFKTRIATREETTDKRLWQSWWVLIPLLMLLTVEWVIRKRFGLA